MTLHIETPFLDRLEKVAALMRTNGTLLHLAMTEARAKGLAPGRFAQCYGKEVALITRYNDVEMSVFPGHDYPLVLLTALGEVECSLEDAIASSALEAIAILEGGEQVQVRPMERHGEWVLVAADGKAIDVRALAKLQLVA